MIVLTNVQKYHSKTGTQYGSLVGTYMSVISSIPYDITKKNNSTVEFGYFHVFIHSKNARAYTLASIDPAELSVLFEYN